MRFSLATIFLTLLSESTLTVAEGNRRLKKAKEPKQPKQPKQPKEPKQPKQPKGAAPTAPPTSPPTAPPTGPPTEEDPCAGKTTPYSEKFPGPYPLDNSERFLYREGIIDEMPSSLCGREGGKNVILVIGDGMGWEMIRAGAIAKLIVKELEEDFGCDTKVGCPDNAAAKASFSGRTLSDYYTEGKGSGLSFQDLEGYALVTTSTTVLQSQNAGAHYAPASSLLEGSVSSHDNGLSPLAVDECTGRPIDFDPRDYEAEGGNMVLWSDAKGGQYPWDENYFTETPDTSSGFDPEFIMQHATDSASTAGSFATGHKAAVNMMSVTLYEEDVSTIVEDAMMCGKAAGVISSVPMLHATPGAFVVHSNYRKNGPQMQRSMKKINPTYIGGGCASRYQASEEHKDEMREGGVLADMWTLLEQSPSVPAANFYDTIQTKDPDNGDHVMMCFGGDYTESGQSNAPYRGLDSTYSNRHCSAGDVEEDEDGTPIGVNPTTPGELCDHYSPEEVAQLPPMKTHVAEAIKFLGKSDGGFFMMYEQGDIDWAAHANHMDDMLGAMLDIDDSVAEIITWIEANGGWESNALYITADHDHFLTLKPHFPEAVANFLINGESHKITPQNNSGVNPWSVAINAGRHEDDSKSQTEHISDFTTWTEEDIEDVGHFWGTMGSGGNGWGSHSSRPVPLSYMGDDGCIEEVMGKGYHVLGKPVVGAEGKVDQVHVHACMMKNLFNL